ncbi:hypothetical protein [Clostridium botulinum]|uniref:hypothetical protein n=1 Tax=Clostridium botulinum TaxID=1491 RepID=UPI001C9A7409|nr:hypothetical protein [Clostridium botulinum]MBY6860800.1 hypothetical protein [Clostridium botulinum]MBY7043811.1 hypothetical protein [Clostridium botulinum]
MSKESMQKATFKDIINKKLKRDQDKLKVVEIPVTSMGKKIPFVKPDDDVILDIMDEISTESTVSQQMAVTRKLIYMSCPMLQDPELHKEINVVDPFDVVKEVFDIADVNEIGEHLSKLIGMDKVTEDIKN